MSAFEIIKAIGIAVASGTTTAALIFAGNKFYKGVLLLIKLDSKYDQHEERIASLVKATTKDIPDQINNLNQDIVETHKATLELFTSEFMPLKEDIKFIKIDIFNLKKHTNYNP